tara:strand:- start:243 stop:635 length:393 start_codon:yes stop_codon:yes gene_type:complete
MDIIHKILVWTGFATEENEVIPEKRKPPSPRRNSHVGSESQRYRVENDEETRRKAILSGIKERKEELQKEGLDEATALKEAITSKKKRLILIRTLQRNKRHCKRIHSDVLFIYEHFKLDTKGLMFKCTAS